MMPVPAGELPDRQHVCPTVWAAGRWIQQRTTGAFHQRTRFDTATINPLSSKTPTSIDLQNSSTYPRPNTPILNQDATLTTSLPHRRGLFGALDSLPHRAAQKDPAY